MTGIELDRGVATELAELLTLLSDWRSSPDHELLSQSLHRFIGVDAYDLPELQADLALGEKRSQLPPDESETLQERLSALPTWDVPHVEVAQP